ncbi:mitogen-activated protein kinase kinase kinase 20-like [Impatiens glandulifera]|uniref:mitogen-activated protein kinase kinase kinase 20-like n=1 Tax=Impatiens glandulifera TaxID=253017 RepID=UPI001FB066A3|nr:mitogen-activated protein kinase kinase kinase 20-like [Impatiens glandulifera]
MSLWERLEKLGEGSYGVVYLGRPLEGHCLYPSISIMAVKSAEYENPSSLLHERDILSKFKECPHIILLYGYDFTVEGTNIFTNIFLEYASGGTLHDRIQSSKTTKYNGISEIEAKEYTLSILKGLRYIHESGYVHCDIKLENILMVDEKAKIGDFGMTIQPFNLPGMTLGTPHYMPPETLNDGEYDTSTDIWALGCSFFEMITSTPQSKYKNMNQNLIKLIKRSKMSKEAFDFWKRCTTKDPKKRWSANMLLQHQFIVGRSENPSTSQNNA